MNPLPSKFYRMLTDVILGIVRFCAGRKRTCPHQTLNPMSEDIYTIERNLDKAITQLAYWKAERDKYLPSRDRRIEWAVTSNQGAIKCFSHKLANRIDELFPTENLFAMISSTKELSNKIEEYELTLGFFQDFLSMERKQLQDAKEKNLPTDILDYLQSRVDKLESNVDRYQTWISTFKSQLKIDEA